MPTNFPTSLDAFTNPIATDPLNSGTVPHAAQHGNINDAVEALQAKVGANASAVKTTLDFQVNNPPRVRAYKSAAQATSHATQTALTFDLERFDSDGMHDTITNNTRITFVTAGTYLITGHATWASAAGNIREIAVRVGGTTEIANQRTPPIGAGFGTILTIATLWTFTAAQYAELVAYQDTGGVVNVALAEFAAIRVGP